MNILWVKAGGLLPADTGGKIRSYNILRQLARRHSVTFFSFYASHPNDLNPTLREIFEEVVCIPLNLPRPKSFAEMREYGKNVLSLQPYSIAKYCRANVRKELRALLARNRYDVILCDFLFAAGVVPWDLPSAKVLFTHNVEAMIWKRHYDVARHPLWKAVSWREWQTMRRAEHGYLKKADHVLAVSETDRDNFLEVVSSGKITVVPTGVDSEYFSPSPHSEVPGSIVFVGSMDWMPNEDAVTYFVRDIFPLIRQRVPEVRLSVVGRDPTARLKALAARQTEISLTGWVQDVRPYVARSAVCIVPLRIGSGTRIKIYESMAMGKAVVSTSIGAEGLPVSHGDNIVLADDPTEFADAVVNLLCDASERRRLGAAARAFVAETYSWQKVTETVEQALAQAT